MLYILSSDVSFSGIEPVEGRYVHHKFRGQGRECGRTAQEPDAFRFGSLREHLHTLALAGVNIIFLALSEPNRLGVNGKVHMSVGRIKALLQGDTSRIFDRSLA